MSLIKYDENIARAIHDQLNCTGITENAVFPKERSKENYRPKSLVDKTLEYIDPTPNIYTLFVQFNQKFFWNVLLPVHVKWSPRMTSCAGVCSFHPRSKECVISLSTPLLKLRPRKDLVETLLHEMIHAYLFLTNDNRDRDGHGPVFQSHMRRINDIAGTNITIYHDFHEEVRLYQQHWWRCNGPCQKRKPFFGTVRRAMNRAPGPNDCWWAEHQATCGGQFIKIKEPEKKKRPTASTVSKAPPKNIITNWVKTNNNNTGKLPNSSTPKKPNKPQITNQTNNGGSAFNKNVPKKPNQSKISDLNNSKSNSISNFQTDLKKIGNPSSSNNVHGWGTSGPNKSSSKNDFPTGVKKIGNSGSINNVHGWGTGGPDSTSSSNNSSSGNNKNPTLSFSGTVGGSGRGRSILLDKFSKTSSSDNSSNSNSFSVQPSTSKSNSFNKSINSSNSSSCVNNIAVIVNCPNCNKAIEESKINRHLDLCLESTDFSEVLPANSDKKRKSEDDFSSPNKMFKNETKSPSISSEVECPLCKKKLKTDKFNDHLDSCLQNDFENAKDDDVVSVHDSSSSSVNLHDSPNHCLICDKELEPGVSLNQHLEECVASVFNDSNEESNDFNDDNDVASIFDDSTGDDKNHSIESTKTDEKEILDEYPCPVCMTLIKQSLMNNHLDECLAKSDWNKDDF